MVYSTFLTLPGQLAADKELPVEDILRDLLTVEPLPTRHSRAEAPSELPSHLEAVELVYLHKGINPPPLPQPYEGQISIIILVTRVWRVVCVRIALSIELFASNLHRSLMWWLSW